MNTCEEHDQTVVVYTSRNCELCETQRQLKDAEQELDETREELQKLQEDKNDG